MSVCSLYILALWRFTPTLCTSNSLDLLRWHTFSGRHTRLNWTHICCKDGRGQLLVSISNFSCCRTKDDCAAELALGWYRDYRAILPHRTRWVILGNYGLAERQLVTICISWTYHCRVLKTSVQPSDCSSIWRWMHDSFGSWRFSRRDGWGD